MRAHRMLALCAIATFTTVLAAADARADVEGFYRGKQIKLIVGSSAGGGYDTYARTVAQYMVKHIPGSPSMVVQNMPGGSSRKAANHLANIAAKDGSVIGAVFSGIPTEPLINPSIAKFKADEFIWLGSANRGIQVGYVWHTAPVRTLEQAMKEPMLLGSSGGATHDFPTLANEILGFKFKLIEGYSGTKEIALAMERGEVYGCGGTTWASAQTQHANWLKSGELKIFVQYGRKPHPDLPDVPVMIDFAKTETDRQALNLAFARQDFARPYLAPPGVPDDRAKALRAAFTATMKDEGYRSDAKKRKLELDALTGEEVEALIAEIYKTPPEVVERVRSILAVKGKK